ncbi:hypothetical protein ACRB68_80260 [Actinomadura sp. RB68]|uniref:Uncharacterized protein n=1 Tax=Actinomadura macrotermitis TaxID=2585200 RepID=A0A7K0C928_9ACTN|nr:hypothetical protein [Actinomadura macrotermitis]
MSNAPDTPADPPADPKSPARRPRRTPKKTGARAGGAFVPIAPTLPNADEALAPHARGARPNARKPKGDDERRSAFTWRLRPDQTASLDGLALKLRMDLDIPRIDRKDWLWALVQVASENPTVYQALLKKLRYSPEIIADNR